MSIKRYRGRGRGPKRCSSTKNHSSPFPTIPNCQICGLHLRLSQLSTSEQNIVPDHEKLKLSSSLGISGIPPPGYDEQAAFVNGLWPGPNFDLLPGEPAIIQNTGGVKFTNIFPGEVLQGYLVSQIPPG